LKGITNLTSIPAWGLKVSELEAREVLGSSIHISGMVAARALKFLP